MTTFWGVCGSCSVDWKTNASAGERVVRRRRWIAGWLTGESGCSRLRWGTAPAWRFPPRVADAIVNYASTTGACGVELGRQPDSGILVGDRAMRAVSVRCNDDAHLWIALDGHSMPSSTPTDAGSA